VQIFSNKNMLFLKPFAEKALQIPIICTFEINRTPTYIEYGMEK